MSAIDTIIYAFNQFISRVLDAPAFGSSILMILIITFIVTTVFYLIKRLS